VFLAVSYFLFSYLYLDKCICRSKKAFALKTAHGLLVQSFVSRRGEQSTALKVGAVDLLTSCQYADAAMVH
jgi:hypothetical protein